MADKNVFIEELEAMRKRMEELFQRNFDPEKSKAERGPIPEGWMPAADVIESEMELIYLIDLPGVLDQDLQVECRADRLWVYGARREEVPAGSVVGIERRTGAFSRMFKLPCPIREDAIMAELRKGVLRIIVPKECSPNTRAQKVSVREAD